MRPPRACRRIGGPTHVLNSIGACGGVAAEKRKSPGRASCADRSQIDDPIRTARRVDPRAYGEGWAFPVLLVDVWTGALTDKLQHRGNELASLDGRNAFGR